MQYRLLINFHLPFLSLSLSLSFYIYNKSKLTQKEKYNMDTGDWSWAEKFTRQC